MIDFFSVIHLTIFFFKLFPSFFFSFECFFIPIFFLPNFFQRRFSRLKISLHQRTFLSYIFFFFQRICVEQIFSVRFFVDEKLFLPSKNFFPKNFFPLKKIFSKRNFSPFELKKLKQVSNNRNVYQTNQRKWKHQKGEEKKYVMQCIWWNSILMADSYKQKSLGSVYFF